MTTEFVGAGAAVGLEIWRIEKMVPTPVPKDTYGQFYSGDSYICLSTKQPPGKNSFEWDIHFWLGEETSQDEAGVAAYKTVELDDYLGGGPVQHREVQGHESKEFLSLFRAGVEYKEGGVDSGFNKVDRDAYETRLLHLKGKRTVRSRRVEATAGSLNSGDVFILDMGMNIYQWNGSSASRMEKSKGAELMKRIRDNERGGKAECHFVEEGSEPQEFWDGLGGKGPIKSAEEGGDDDAAEKSAAKELKLYRVSDASGSLQVDEVATAPLKKDMLDTNDAFIVDTGAEIFAWVGKGATKQEKNAAMQNAQGFLAQNDRPNWTPITRVVEGAETPIFKGNFADWHDPIPKVNFGQTSTGVAQRKAQHDIDVGAMARGGGAEAQSMVDDGSGKLEIWRIEDFQKVPVPEDLYGQFFGGDSYVLLYTYLVNGKENFIIYFWQGRESSQDEKGASALLAKELDDSLGGAATQVRVVMNKEPNHFLQLFKGKMIVHEGGKASGFANRADVDSYDTDGISLFHVKGTNEFNTRGVQVPEKASSLNSGDCFVLLTPGTMYQWQGKGSSDEEQKVAATVADILKGSRGNEVVPEGQEPDAFWDALGGKGEYASSSDLGEASRPPRLFQCSNATGVFDVEEVYNFVQEDLVQDDVMLLDTYNEVFIWIGKGANAQEKKMAMETAIKYVDGAGDGRSSDETPILQVQAGCEPPMFTQCFIGWDYSQADDPSDPYAKAVASMKSVKEVMAEQNRNYTLEELQKRPVPEHLDATILETYLSDADFEKALGMPKADYNKLPKWKQQNAKKKVGLF